MFFNVLRKIGLRRASTLLSVLGLISLGAGQLPGEQLSARKATKEKSTSAAKATPRPANETAGSKEAGAPKKSTAKKPTGTRAASTAPKEEEAPSRTKRSGKPAATPKPGASGTSQAGDGDPEAKPGTGKEAAPASAKLPADTSSGANDTPLRKDGHAPNATLEAAELAEFSAQPPRVQALIEGALALTKRQLTYAYGSADPESGGMDCSGTIYYLLRAHGIMDVPRDSAGQYTWLRKAGTFRAVVSKSATSFEFDELLPGDLMFWSGTYNIQREIPVTHVMLYLGTEKKTKKRVMFGASDGRTYDGLQRWGVSVFDFKMPRNDPEGGAKTDFLGYARIPGLRDPSAAADMVLADAPPVAGSEETQPAPAAQDDSTKTPVDASAEKMRTKKAAAKRSGPAKSGAGKRKRKS